MLFFSVEQTLEIKHSIQRRSFLSFSRNLPMSRRYHIKNSGLSILPMQIMTVCYHHVSVAASMIRILVHINSLICFWRIFWKLVKVFMSWNKVFRYSSEHFSHVVIFVINLPWIELTEKFQIFQLLSNFLKRQKLTKISWKVPIFLQKQTFFLNFSPPDQEKPKQLIFFDHFS